MTSSPEAIKKPFSGSLSIKTTLSINFEEKPRLAGTFFLPLYKFRGKGELPHSGKRGCLGHAPEFMNLLRKFILCVLPHEAQESKFCFFDRLGRDVLIPPL